MHRSCRAWRFVSRLYKEVCHTSPICLPVEPHVCLVKDLFLKRTCWWYINQTLYIFYSSRRALLSRSSIIYTLQRINEEGRVLVKALLTHFRGPICFTTNKIKLPRPSAVARFHCSVHVAPWGWRRNFLVQPYQNGATQIPMFSSSASLFLSVPCSA